MLRLSPTHLQSLTSTGQFSHFLDWAPRSLISIWRRSLEYRRCWKQVSHSAGNCAPWHGTAGLTVRIARELTLEAAQSAASNRSSKPDYASRTYSAAHIKKLLDSRHEREVLDGMRRVIAVW